RAIRYGALKSLNLDAQTYGWTVQMQARALKQNLRVAEVPVHYRRRVGQSKISGTVKGVILAGFYILSVIGLEAMRDFPMRRP
ncbi:MAG: glycosyltransferase family 2 protein, partial [Pseudomonadota bacterium]